MRICVWRIALWLGVIWGGVTARKNQCGDYDIKAGGALYSPNYPQDYPNHLNCAYRITAPEGQVVHLEVRQFDVENEETCSHDYLSFRDSANESREIVMCGDNVAGYDFTSTGNVVYVAFHTDESVSKSGFDLHHQATSDVCGDLSISAGRGSLTSPGYPDFYPNDVDCVYTITTPTPGKVLRLVVEVLDIEDGEFCTYDYLEFDDPYGDGTHTSGKLCGANMDMAVYTFVSLGNAAIVKFHSDHTVTSSGFTIHFEEIDPPEIPPATVALLGNSPSTVTTTPVPSTVLLMSKLDKETILPEVITAASSNLPPETTLESEIQDTAVAAESLDNLEETMITEQTDTPPLVTADPKATTVLPVTKKGTVAMDTELLTAAQVSIIEYSFNTGLTPSELPLTTELPSAELHLTTESSVSGVDLITEKSVIEKPVTKLPVVTEAVFTEFSVTESPENNEQVITELQVTEIPMATEEAVAEIPDTELPASISNESLVTELSVTEEQVATAEPLVEIIVTQLPNSNESLVTELPLIGFPVVAKTAVTELLEAPKPNVTSLTLTEQPLTTVAASAPQESDVSDLVSTPVPSAETAEHAEAEHAEAKHAEAEHTGAKHADAEHSEAEHAEPEHAEAEHAEGEHAVSEHAEAEDDESEHTEAEHAEVEHAEAGHAEAQEASKATASSATENMIWIVLIFPVIQRAIFI